MEINNKFTFKELVEHIATNEVVMVIDIQVSMDGSLVYNCCKSDGTYMSFPEYELQKTVNNTKIGFTVR